MVSFNVNTINKLMGKSAVLSKDGLQFLVMIKDAKVVYGGLRFLVSPVAGSGESWVQMNSLKFEGEDPAENKS